MCVTLALGNKLNWCKAAGPSSCSQPGPWCSRPGSPELPRAGTRRGNLTCTEQDPPAQHEERHSWQSCFLTAATLRANSSFQAAREERERVQHIPGDCHVPLGTSAAGRCKKDWLRSRLRVTFCHLRQPTPLVKPSIPKLLDQSYKFCAWSTHKYLFRSFFSLNPATNPVRSSCCSFSPLPPHEQPQERSPHPPLETAILNLLLKN